MSKRADELKQGDLFRLHVHGEVVAVEPVADGKRIKVRIALNNQATGLEFLDEGHTVTFMRKPGRLFQVVDSDDDDGDELEPEDNPSPRDRLTV